MLKKRSAKVLALFLAVMMIVGIFPLSIFAASTTNYPEGCSRVIERYFERT